MKTAEKQQQQPTERIYLAEIEQESEPALNDRRAKEMLDRHAGQIFATGNAADMARAFGNGPAIIRVILRGATINANPADMFPGEAITFREVFFGGTIPLPPADAVDVPSDQDEEGAENGNA